MKPPWKWISTHRGTDNDLDTIELRFSRLNTNNSPNLTLNEINEIAIATLERMNELKQTSRVVYKATGNCGGNCCHYTINYDARKNGWRCRVCGTVYKEKPANKPAAAAQPKGDGKP
jgi:hypothetical protein